MSSARKVVRGGLVVTMASGEAVPAVADVEVRAERITAIGPDLDTEGAEVIDARGCIVAPGLIDSHVHLWQTPLRGAAADIWAGEYRSTVLPRRAFFRPADVYAGAAAGAAVMLAAGVTTVVDFCHALAGPDHARANVRALRESGIRAVHAHSLRVEEPGRFERDERFAFARELQQDEFMSGPGDLVSLMLAPTDLHTVGREVTAAEVELARALGVRMTFHTDFPGEVADLAGRSLLGPDMTLVHGNVLTDEELDLLAGADASLVVTPEIEVGMGKPFSTLGRAVRRGVVTSLGTCLTSLVEMDVFAQARLAYRMQRWIDAEGERSAGRWPLRRYDELRLLDSRRVLSMVTIDAARAIGQADRIGSLEVGKQADLILVDPGMVGMSVAGPEAHLVQSATRSDVALTMVAGRVRARNGRALGFDHDRLAADLQATRMHVLATGDLVPQM
jgi:cytosine/adenosine deaminase-related metal-dependent hydrolase